MPNITTSYQWAITTCNAANVGYSQSYRNQQTVDGITYYDCSSFIWYALKAGGFDVEAAYKTAMGFDYSGNAIVTDYEAAWLKALGFTKVSLTGTWKKGDVLIRNGHTEMVYSGRRTMGAHSSSYPLADQVSINTSDSSPSSWEECWRYEGGAEDYKWISGNRYLSQNEMNNNAYCTYNYLDTKGWSLNAICALLANMQAESTINPGIWQNLDAGNNNMGFGLVQWTPATKIRNRSGFSATDGDWQLSQVIKDGESGEQWFPNDQVTPVNPPITFKEFEVSTLDLDTLTKYFMWYFEHPGDPTQDRSQAATYYYELLSGYTPQPPTPPSPPSGSGKKMKYIYYLKPYYKYFM